MILSKRPEVERFCKDPPPDIRAVLIYGRDRGGVRERANAIAARATARPDDPFDVALLTDADIVADPARLDSELSALSLMGGRRLVRLRLFDDKAAPDRIAAEALKAHAEGAFNTAALLLIEAGALGRDSALRGAAEKAKAGAVAIPCYEDEVGDVARMARETMARDGVSLTGEAMEMFAARLPAEGAAWRARRSSG